MTNLPNSKALHECSDGMNMKRHRRYIKDITESDPAITVAGRSESREGKGRKRRITAEGTLTTTPLAQEVTQIVTQIVTQLV